MQSEFIGVAVGGSVMGLMGAVVGVYFATRSAKGFRERAFVWRISVVGFVWMVAILVTM